MSSSRRVDWRARLDRLPRVGALLTAAYLWFRRSREAARSSTCSGSPRRSQSPSASTSTGPRRAALVLFIVGQFLFFAGDLYTYSYPKLFGADVEFPSLGDAIYLTVYPALVAGLLILVRRRNPRGDRRGVIDSLILTSASR
jgi:hypothetical protein